MAIFGLPGGAEIWIILTVCGIIFVPVLLIGLLIWFLVKQKPMQSSTVPPTPQVQAHVANPTNATIPPQPGMAPHDPSRPAAPYVPPATGEPPAPPVPPAAPTPEA